MKSIISKSMMLLAICTALLSFTSKPGAEGFEIYVNNKVVIQKFGNEINTVQNLQLNLLSANDQLTIKYHHCGKVGKNRVVTIKDAQNKVLKEFRYADAATPVTAMAVNVKDLLNLKKGNSATLKLYYASSELIKERLLTALVTSSASNAKP